jgi:elongation factor 1-beta
MPARVLAIIKILPEDDKVSLEGLKEHLKAALPTDNKEIYIHKFEVEPIAFGLNALKVYVILPGVYEGGTQKVEDNFAKIKGVSNVEVEMVRSLLA